MRKKLTYMCYQEDNSGGTWESNDEDSEEIKRVLMKKLHIPENEKTDIEILLFNENQAFEECLNS